MSIAPLINDHSFLAEELLIPNANKTDGSRMNMVCSQFSQLLVMNNAEPPLVFTNFENQVGSKSSGLVLAKENAEIVEVLPYNDCRALVLIKYDTGVLDLIEYRFAKNLTESFGYTTTSHIEEIGQKFEKGDVLFYNGMYDEYRNFQYGINLRTVYLPFKGKTYEDAIVISKSAAKLLSHTTVTQYLVVLNRNDVCVYEVPKVGEEIQDGILTARRRISNQTILDSFKNDEFSVLRPGDTPFFGEGIITDVEVMCNTPEDLEYPYNAHFKEVFENQNALYKDFLETLERKDLRKLKLSDNVLFWKRKATDILDPEMKFEYDKREFEGLVVRVDVVTEHDCEIGSKLTGRYGNKGVVSLILPDDQMPRTTDGRYADVVSNSLGVVGRLNPSQLFEHELNFITEELHLRSKTVKEFTADILQFYAIVDPDYYNFLMQELDEDSFSELFDEMYESGKVPVRQAPFFGNAEIKTMQELYSTFNISKVKFDNIQTPLVFGRMYFTKLKHEPKKKLSARSTGLTSLLDIPYKSSESYKRGNSLYNNNPVKMGEQELFNMLLLERPKALSQFLKAYSTSNVHRNTMLLELLSTPIEELDKFPPPEIDTPSNNAQTMRALFRGIGVDIRNVETDEDN